MPVLDIKNYLEGRYATIITKTSAHVTFLKNINEDTRKDIMVNLIFIKVGFRHLYILEV